MGALNAAGRFCRKAATPSAKSSVLPREGAMVLVNDRFAGAAAPTTRPACRKLAHRVCAAGGQAVSNSKSVTDMGAVKDMVAQAIDKLGGRHAVINPARFLRQTHRGCQARHHGPVRACGRWRGPKGVRSNIIAPTA